MQENGNSSVAFGNSSAQQPQDDDSSANTIHAVAGLLNFSCNLTLFAALLCKNRRTRMDRFLAAYAFGSSLLGLGYASEAMKYLLLHNWQVLVRPAYCLLVSPNVLLYAIGDNMASFSIFCMAMNSFVAICFTQVSGILRQAMQRSVLLCILFPVGDATWCWISAFSKDHEKIPILCDYMETVGSLYAVYHVCVVSIVGAVSIAVYVAALILLMRRKSSSSGVRAVQIRREAAVMKQVLFIVLVTFLFLSMPNIIEMLSILEQFIKIILNVVVVEEEVLPEYSVLVTGTGSGVAVATWAAAPPGDVLHNCN
ncbi:hypothetical protein M514_04510 [Trichuris suis]|uniref:G-protein coupled receptors family 1 profile domain-containing protein n=1 Tax=Trichuris suis TaxID=68888 RepID=A0A085N604_9BILA|nr:hypothetical protein M513_04510 [Trichuris suis]KFD64900.1 hypothetical protein M514_04510 [Trichuris suis]